MYKEELIETLQEIGIYLNKSLGQCFLVSDVVRNEIIKKAGIVEDELILEIGPGIGMLTSEFLAHKARVTAIDISKKCIEYLNREYPESKATFIKGDILDFRIKELLKLKGGQEIENDSPRKIYDYRVISNIPYYLTGKIIPFFLENEAKPKEIILMVQKEVADRIVAKKGKESIMSISTKFFADVEKLFDVTKDNFFPEPKVDSAVIRIKTKKEVPEVDQKMFFKVMKAGFINKRKQLHNSLAATFHLTREETESWIKKAGIDPKSRPEDLSVDEFVELTKLSTSF